MNMLKRAASALAFAVVFSFSAQAGNPPAPDAVYGKLFNDVQLSGIFGDSKAFPDCVPVKSPALIVRDYEKARKTPGFSLGNFVADNFTFPVGPAAGAVAVSTGADTREHVIALWPLLERPRDAQHEGSSLLALPYPYIVPGGRFREIYYWDSYFTMLGLLQSGKIDTMENTVKNFAFLIDTYGHIPNGNRSYYLSRSQPPYFTLMVKLLQKARGKNSGVIAQYLPAIEKEYKFWMADSGKLKKDGDAARRTVKYGSAILNRYWDDNPVPRQESYKEDIETAKSSIRRAPEMYRDIRAAAESGMDFSSRWFADGKNLASIETAAIIPVDLNCLLYDVEMTLADAYKTGDKKKAGFYAERAARRKDAVNKFMYDPAARFYTDFDFKKGARTGRLTLAGMYPFFLNAAPQDRIAGAAKTLADSFLKDGGVVTTLAQTGQQWDSPNGWPPLQWITVTGLLNYGQKDLALDIARRWTSLNEKVYKRTGKMMEKYNVVDTSLEAGGGEYPGQDGFGWTNGVYLALKALAEKN